MDWSAVGKAIPLEDFGDTIVLDWLDTFRQHSWDNEFYGYATFHLVVGQLPNIRKMKIFKTQSSYIDPRVHVCYLADSGSGKGEGANFASRMCKRLRIGFQKASQITDNALIGTIQQNKKTGEQWIDWGWFHPEKRKDIIAMLEASTLMTDKPKKEAQDMMNHLQEAMNPLGSEDGKIVKKIGYGDEIEIQPRCSLFLTSFPPNNLTDVVVSRGFLQRMYLIVRTLTPEDREESSRQRQIRIENPPNTEEMEISIADRLLYVNQFYSNVESIPFNPEAVHMFQESSTKLYKKLENVTPFLKAKLGEFITRFEDTQYKLAHHYACMNLRMEVARDDAYHAMLETQNIFEDLISYLERFIVVPKSFEERFKLTRERVNEAMFYWLESPKYQSMETNPHRWVQEKDVTRYLVEVHTVTEQTAIEYLKLVRSAKLLQQARHPTLGTLLRLRERSMPE